MANKKIYAIASITFILLFLSFSMVSAGWFGDFWNKITGNAIATQFTSTNEQINLTIIQEGQTTTIRTTDGQPLSPIVMQNKLTAYTEVAPIILDNKIFISTGWTYSSDYNPLQSFIQYPDAFRSKFISTNKLVYGGDIYVNNYANPIIQRSSLNNNVLGLGAFQNSPFWRSAYGGIYDIEKINNTLYALMDGENVNTRFNGNCYQSNIVPEIICSGCNSPDNNSQYAYGCPWTYRTFVNLGYTRNLDGTGLVDEGPIVWPSNGFTNYDAINYDGFGIAHPGSIVKDNYLYVFYKDFSDGDSYNGRGYGIKVARAPINNAHPGYFETYYKLANGTEGWDFALPIEFWSGNFYVKGKDVWNSNYRNSPQGWRTINGCTMWNYGNGWLDRLDKRGFQCFNNISNYSIKGGKSSWLFGDHPIDNSHMSEWPILRTQIFTAPGAPPLSVPERYHSTTLFKVTKIKGTDYYLGVEDGSSCIEPCQGSNYWYWIGFRISKDLIHWSNVTIIESTKVTENQGWGAQKLGHVHFLSSDFKASKEIDPNGFYLVGSHGDGDGTWRVQQLNYKSMKIKLNGEYKCDGKDDDGDGKTDEGCDDDYDHYADSSMECVSGDSFWSLEYNGDMHSAGWYNGWYYYSNGWRGKTFSCSTNSRDRDDLNSNINQ